MLWVCPSKLDASHWCANRDFPLCPTKHFHATNLHIMISGERTKFAAEVSEQEQGMDSSQMFWGAGLCVRARSTATAKPTRQTKTMRNKRLGQLSAKGLASNFRDQWDMRYWVMRVAETSTFCDAPLSKPLSHNALFPVGSSSTSSLVLGGRRTWIFFEWN